MNLEISSQFVQVGERKVFLRYAGEGPAILLLHQSPQNSRAMAGWINRLAGRYAVFAPDTPGFGFSDPLPLAQPSTQDYAIAVRDLMNALSIERAMVFGVHTGAVTALRLGLDFPDRVAAVVCDGYALFSDEEKEALLTHYLPPFEPCWDGSHLTWLVARMREQRFFFPWFATDQHSRMAYPPAGDELLHEDVLDVLLCGDGYRQGYRAPFSHNDPQAAARLVVPTRIFYRREDVLAPHIDRLPALAPCVVAETLSGGTDELIAKSDACFAFYENSSSRVRASQKVDQARSTRRYLAQHNGHIVGFLARDGKPGHLELVIPELGTPAQLPPDLDGRAARVVELPGHGACPRWAIGTIEVRQIAQAIVDGLSDGDWSQVHIRCQGLSSAIGIEVAWLLGSKCIGLQLENPLPLSETERNYFLDSLPDLRPNRTGGQFMEAWYWARMSHLFCWWQPLSVESARIAPAPAPRKVQQEATALIQAGDNFAALATQVLSVDIALALRSLSCGYKITWNDPALTPMVERLQA